MKKYIYPDEGDFLTSLYISTKSDEKYWEESEKNILNKMIDKIQGMPKLPNMLDVGCGYGRLFDVFYPYVETITGIEPDYNRYLNAKQNAMNINPEKIKVVNEYIDYIKDEYFDVALVSHIFQHIPFESINHTLSILNMVIPTGGYVFVTTTFSNTSEDIYTLEYLKDGEYVSELVTERDFANRFEEKGVLPVRNISFNTMERLFRQNDFEILEMYGYHFNISEENSILTIEFDEEENRNKIFKEAKDMLYIVKRK